MNWLSLWIFHFCTMTLCLWLALILGGESKHNLFNPKEDSRTIVRSPKRDGKTGKGDLLKTGSEKLIKIIKFWNGREKEGEFSERRMTQRAFATCYMMSLVICNKTVNPIQTVSQERLRHEWLTRTGTWERKAHKGNYAHRKIPLCVRPISVWAREGNDIGPASYSRRRAVIKALSGIHGQLESHAAWRLFQNEWNTNTVKKSPFANPETVRCEHVPVSKPFFTPGMLHY